MAVKSLKVWQYCTTDARELSSTDSHASNTELQGAGNMEQLLDQSRLAAELEKAEQFRALIRGVAERSDLLPYLFRLRGKPYSLRNHVQFREMFSSTLVPDTLFMTGRQVGKSLSLSRSEILNCLTIPHFQTLYVAPLQKQAQRYSTLYLKEAIATCQLARELQSEKSELLDGNIIKSVMHQTFGNGSGIQLSYAKTSPDRARGIYADAIDFDEIQDQTVDNIPIISESLTSSSYRIRRFTGTAKTTDNTIEALWQRSSMCEWSMKCGCGHWNIPTVDGGILDMLSYQGLSCAKCGRRLDVRAGLWVPAFPDRMNYFRGYHIPQVILPDLADNPGRWSAIMKKVADYTLAMLLQEVMGISWSQGARLITQAEINKFSTLPNVLELAKRRNQYVMTIGGVDWGVAEQQSFTVHTIIGVRPDSTFDVIWARRFTGFDPDTVLKAIAQAHRYYGCKMLGADFGMGFDKNVMLEERFGVPVVQIQYTRQNQFMRYNPLLGRHRWTVDKVTALEQLFLGIRYGRFRFPPQSEFQLYTNDLLSPYERQIESSGLTTRVYDRNPSQPDDFCHALCFAYLVAMKAMGEPMTKIVPDNSMGTEDMPGSDIPPDIQNIDPKDFLSSGNI